jgi:hypothetical protein
MAMAVAIDAPRMQCSPRIVYRSVGVGVEVEKSRSSWGMG